ncbi:transposase, partial [Myceligenerans halotolerans]
LENGFMGKDSKAGESAPADVVGAGPRSQRAARRSFTMEFKRAIVAEYDAAPVGQKGAVLRRERLYDSHVQEWRAAIEAGTLEKSSQGRRRGGRPARSAEQTRIAELERQVARLEAEAAAKDEVIASKEAALDVLGKGVAFLESLSSKNA